MGNDNSHKVAIKDKVLLTVTEVAAYSGVGQNKLDEILLDFHSVTYVSALFR